MERMQLRGRRVEGAHMSDTLPPLDLDARARTRVIREAIGLVLTTLLVGTIFLGPLIGVLTVSIPQVMVAAPEPIRQATIYLVGLEGPSEEEATGADGDDADGEAVPDEAEEPSEAVEEVPEAPEDVPEVPETPAPSPKPKPKAEPEPEAPPEPTPAPPSEAPAAQEGQEAAVAAAEPEPPKARRGRSGRCENLVPEIERVAEGEFTIRRALIDHYTADLKTFNTLGWSRRYEADDTKGWQVGGFGCTSPLFKAGLRSSDVVRYVNGKKTWNVLQILGLWLGQRKKETFEVVVLRKGQELTLRYTLLD